MLEPTFTLASVTELENENPHSIDLNGHSYLPGYVGLNNIKSNDYVNAVVQGLSQVVPLRKYLLLNKFETFPELGILLYSYW